MRRRTTYAIAAAAVLATAASLSPASAASGPVPIATGLDNPRQLALGPAGMLLVAEAGAGGETAGVTAVRRPRSSAPRQLALASGLDSISETGDGMLGIGANGVASDGLGRIYVAMTNLPPDFPDAQEVPDSFGDLLRVTARGGEPRTVADISAVEYGTPGNPDGTDVNSNPYSVAARKGRIIVADAGGNTLIEVVKGQPRVFKVLPSQQLPQFDEAGNPVLDDEGNPVLGEVQPVPTAVAFAPDGTIWVGELGAFYPGAARVWHLSARGDVLHTVGGFTTIHGLGVAPDGSVYVSELLSGKVIHLSASGERLGSADVPFPAGVAVDRKYVYVSAFSVSDADGGSVFGQPVEGGQVWRLPRF